MLDQLAQQTVTEGDGERHWKVLARAILDGFPVGELQQRFPGAAKVVQRAQESHADEHAARVAAADALALQLGWRLFGPFLRSATGLGDLTEAELRKDVDVCAAAILNAPD